MIGKSLAETIFRDFSVHWKTSVNRVSEIITRTQDELDVFKILAYKILTLENQTDIISTFNVICGQEPPSRVIPLLPRHLSEIAQALDTGHWKKTEHWAVWWQRERMLRMLCKAFTLRDTEDWDSSPNTNNPAESLNKQSIPEGSNNIAVLLKNIYLEDRLHAVKIVAKEKNINMDYGSRSQQANPNKTKTFKSCQSR